MQRTILRVLAVAFTLGPVAVFTQAQQTGTNTKEATLITKEEIDTVNKLPGVDRQIRVIDVGVENYAVGIVHRAGNAGGAGGGGGRGAGGGGGAAGGGRGAGGGAAPEPCGEANVTVPAGTPTGLYHESQTEGYSIVSGAGKLVTGGHIANGRKSNPTDQVTTTLNGPSCNGSIVGPDVMIRDVKEGDIIVIPAGVPHGWSTIPDHVDYLSFRPSARVLAAGYINPAIKK